MSVTKIFVGNLSFSINDYAVKEYFAEAGSVVSAKVMTEGQGGRSRGFGFVEFATPEEAQAAIDKFNGQVWEGRVLKVSEDRSSQRGSDRAPKDGDRQSSAPMGYFRAQPLDLGTRRRRKTDPFLDEDGLILDYKNPRILTRFMSERGRILPRRMTGLTTQNQRRVTKAIKRAQQLALLPIIRE